VEGARPAGVALPLPPGTVSDDGRIWTGPVLESWVVIDGGERVPAGTLTSMPVDDARALYRLA
jgi:hypothetical protein